MDVRDSPDSHSSSGQVDSRLEKSSEPPEQPALLAELERLRAENARLLRLLALSPAQALPPGPVQSGVFDAPPGSVTTQSTPQTKVAFLRHAVRGADRHLRNTVGEHPDRGVRVAARRARRVAQGISPRGPGPPSAYNVRDHRSSVR